MDFEVTPEERALVESVSAVLAAECPTALVRDVVENGSSPEQPWKSARELGWTGIDLPGALDGVELGFTALGLVVAIPLLLLRGLLRGRADRILADCERHGASALVALAHGKAVPTGGGGDA